MLCYLIFIYGFLFSFTFFVFDRRTDTSEYVFAYSEVKLNCVVSGAFIRCVGGCAPHRSDRDTLSQLIKLEVLEAERGFE